MQWGKAKKIELVYAAFLTASSVVALDSYNNLPATEKLLAQRRAKQQSAGYTNSYRWSKRIHPAVRGFRTANTELAVPWARAPFRDQ